MKLGTTDLVGFVKQRQFEQVRAMKLKPKLLVLMAGDDAASASFVRAKQRYGEDIGVFVEVKATGTRAELEAAINDAESTGVIVQLPLASSFDTDAVLKLIPKTKDIDHLGPESAFEAPTAKGIMWLLGSLHLKLTEQTIAVVGQGKLVGAPISEVLEASGARVIRCDINTPDLAAAIQPADIVISGVGRPGLITAEMLKSEAIVIDAGTTETAGAVQGDADPSLYDHATIRVTPVPGGVGPLTVAALFDNLLIAQR